MHKKIFRHTYRGKNASRSQNSMKSVPSHYHQRQSWTHCILVYLFVPFTHRQKCELQKAHRIYEDVLGKTWTRFHLWKRKLSWPSISVVQMICLFVFLFLKIAVLDRINYFHSTSNNHSTPNTNLKSNPMLMSEKVSFNQLFRKIPESNSRYAKITEWTVAKM